MEDFSNFEAFLEYSYFTLIASMDSKFKRSVLLSRASFAHAYIHSLGRSRDQRYRSSNICTLRNHQLGKNWNPWAVICELIKLSCQASKDHPRISCFQWKNEPKNVPWYVIILRRLFDPLKNKSLEKLLQCSECRFLIVNFLSTNKI